VTVAMVLIVAVLAAYLIGGGISRGKVAAKLSNTLAGPHEKKWNAWRFPTPAETAGGADPWVLVFVGSADYPEDAREMLPEQGGQVQEGLTGPVTTYVNEDHELAARERARARERERPTPPDAA
jgi:hypothetical protein